MNARAILIGAFVLAGVVFAAWTFLKPPPAERAEPPASTGTTGTTVVTTPIVEVTLPADLSAEAEIGKRVFDAKCASCHGENAAGLDGVAPPLVHKIYEPGHHSDAAFQLAVKNGVRSHHWNFGNMPPVEGLTSAEVQYLARYVRELQRANGIF